MPGAIGTLYVAGLPPLRSPRKISKTASAIVPPLIASLLLVTSRPLVTSRRQQVVSDRRAIPAPAIDESPSSRPRGQLHYSCFPSLRRGLGDRCGCEHRGSLREPGRCAYRLRRPPASTSTPAPGASRD